LHQEDFLNRVIDLQCRQHFQLLFLTTKRSKEPEFLASPVLGLKKNQGSLRQGFQIGTSIIVLSKICDANRILLLEQFFFIFIAEPKSSWTPGVSNPRSPKGFWRYRLGGKHSLSYRPVASMSHKVPIWSGHYRRNHIPLPNSSPSSQNTYDFLLEPRSLSPSRAIPAAWYLDHIAD